jgi:ribosomal protein S18 acetylase RimI-like enzyme
MNQVNFRRMNSEDQTDVIAIQEEITRRSVSKQWRDMLGDHVGNPLRPAYVAEENGRVVGFILGEIKVGEFGNELSGWLGMVGVKPDHMGKGIGANLAQELFRDFKEKKVQEVFTAVPWDSGDMLAFFKNLGFDRSAFINLQLGL